MIRRRRRRFKGTKVMSLPIEIIDRVVTSGLDSLESLLAWSKVGSHFRTIIKRKLGVLKIWDLDRESSKTLADPCNYELLSDERNTACVNTDTFKFPVLSEFLRKFDNVLIVIVSDRCYSDPLATALCELSRGLSGMGTLKNLCFMYKTTTNFLSKFYFRELSHCQSQLRLCELHIFANRDINHQEVDMFDIDTIFETTYLHDVETLFTLNIRRGKKVIAPRIMTVNQLQCEDNTTIVDDLQYCPLLKTIEKFQVPPGKRVVLPPCDHLTLVSYNSNTERDLVDGSFVRESLTIRASPMCSEANFKNIKCRNIRSLCVEFSNSVWGNVKFIDCAFGNLRSYRCPVNTEWEDLVYSNSIYVDTIIFKISNMLSLQNLAQIPFTLDNLVLNSDDKELKPPECKPDQMRSIYGCKQVIQELKRLEFELSSIWDCAVFQHVIIPNLTNDSELCLTINESHIARELEKAREWDRSLYLLESLQLDWNRNKIRFCIPKLKAFQLSIIRERMDETRERVFQLPVGTMSLLHPLLATNGANYVNLSEHDVIEFIDTNA